MDAVTPGASPEHHNHIVHADIAGVLALGCQAHRATKHQRIGNIAWVEINGAVDNRHADFVAIILDAGNHPDADLMRRQYLATKGIDLAIIGPKTKDISSGNRLRRYPQYVTQHPTHTRIGAAKGLECRRMVVGLDFER